MLMYTLLIFKQNLHFRHLQDLIKREVWALASG